MNKPNISRRGLIIAALSLIASASVAVAAVCSVCQGSGTGNFKCFSCKGTGSVGNFKCSACNGKGFSKCGSCGGTGQR